MARFLHLLTLRQLAICTIVLAAEDEIFWGRYRDWGNVNLLHVFSLLLMFIGVIVIYGYISRNQFNRRSELCDDLMKGRLRIKESNLSKKDSEKLEKYFFEQKQYQNELIPQDGGKGDPGYGASNNTHYNTSIAKSYFVLEEAVRATRPNLRHKHYRTIREFVEDVAKEFPKLKEQCYKYIDLYELARFGDYKCTQNEFEDFLSLLGSLVNGLKDPHEQ